MDDNHSRWQGTGCARCQGHGRARSLLLLRHRLKEHLLVVHDDQRLLLQKLLLLG
jgi:hypothetical protein